MITNFKKRRLLYKDKSLKLFTHLLHCYFVTVQAGHIVYYFSLK